MRVFGWLVVLSMAFVGRLPAQTTEPDGGRVFTADLARDGSAYSIATRKFATTDAGDYFQLVVTDAAGRVRWAGPREPDEASPLVFGAWHHGVCLPECVGDIDGDGRIELVAPGPQSDVSPTSFRVLRWTGSAFELLRTGVLLEEPAGSGRYPWSRSGRSQGRWVSRFRKADRGAVTAEIVDMDGGESLRNGTAVLTAHAQGYRIKSWSQPLSSPGTGDSSSSLLKARYMCQIGPDDLIPSGGGRLREVRDILRQDRANFHRYGIRDRRDLADETFFATPSHRELFESLPLDCPSALAARIIAGNATVGVRVYSDRVVVRQPDDHGEY